MKQTEKVLMTMQLIESLSIEALQHWITKCNSFKYNAVQVLHYT